MATTEKKGTARKTGTAAKAATAKSAPAKAAPKKPRAAAKPVAPKSPPKRNVKSTAAPARTGPAKGKVMKDKSKAGEDTRNFREKAGDTARGAAERGKERTVEAVSNIGKIIRDSAATLDENVGNNYGDLARNAADSLDSFAKKIEEKPVDDIAEDTRNFIRKSPAIAIGAAAAIGFVLARLFRSGRDDDA